MSASYHESKTPKIVILHTIIADNYITTQVVISSALRQAIHKTRQIFEILLCPHLILRESARP